MMYVFKDSLFDYEDVNRPNMYKWIYDTFVPVIYKGETESIITWNNAPPLGTLISTTDIVDTDTAKYKTFDVSSYIKQELALGHKTITIGIYVPNSSSNVTSFNSKEASAETAPKLVLYK